jgi:hypothetical protein
MNRIELKSERRRGRGSIAARTRRLRPTVLALEGRTLRSTLIVNNTNDSGTGSLRAAVNQANASNEADTIVFSSLFNSPQTINLTSGALELTDTAKTTITGPRANLLAMVGDAQSNGSVFEITKGAVAALSGLVITGGTRD